MAEHACGGFRLPIGRVPTGGRYAPCVVVGADVQVTEVHSVADEAGRALQHARRTGAH
jgi:hypothetical protein